MLLDTFTAPLLERQRKKTVLWIAVLWMAGLLVTAVSTAALYDYQQTQLQTRFNDAIQRASDDILRRFQTPVFGLMGIRGIHTADEAVSRREFQRYLETRHLPTEFPGVRGLGFIERVPRAELNAFVLRERADGMPNFAVRSLDMAEEVLYVIKHVEPLATNRSAVGLDVGSEAVRREGAERAARSGQPVLSGVIRLVQDGQSRPGFLL